MCLSLTRVRDCLVVQDAISTCVNATWIKDDRHKIKYTVVETITVEVIFKHVHK